MNVYLDSSLKYKAHRPGDMEGKRRFEAEDKETRLEALSSEHTL